jgi:hypothetical protein
MTGVLKEICNALSIKKYREAGAVLGVEGSAMLFRGKNMKRTKI